MMLRFIIPNDGEQAVADRYERTIHDIEDPNDYAEKARSDIGYSRHLPRGRQDLLYRQQSPDPLADKFDPGQRLCLALHLLA